MGWASGGEIFNTVARALINADAGEHIIRAVLPPLIDHLTDGDWDTVDESIDEFRDRPLIVELLTREIGTDLYGEAYGEIDYDADRDRWILRCHEHRETLDEADGTAEGHDRLVRLWVAHDRDHHGGDGQVDPDYLISPAGEVPR